MKLQTFQTIDGIDITLFKNFAKEPLDVVMLVVEFKQSRGIDGYQFGIFNDLNAFLRRALGKQAFYAGNDLVFKSETFGDVDAIFVVKNPGDAFLDEVDGFAGMADGLEDFVFFEVQEMGDGEDLFLAVFAKYLESMEVVQ